MPQNIGFYALDKEYASDNVKYTTKGPIVQWLRCSTRIHKILCSNLSIIIHGMTLDKSLTAKLSRMTHLYHANMSSVSMFWTEGVQIPSFVKLKRR